MGNTSSADGKSAYRSSTRDIPDSGEMPQHVAMIMDGNGRWAKKRLLPRVAGHKKGVEVVRDVVRACLERNIGFLTLFAFSSENWRRPADEVSFLMQLFIHALKGEVRKLHANGVRLRVVGDLGRFEPALQELIREAEAMTAANERLTLTIAANYGGRWDLLQAVNRLSLDHPERAGRWCEADIEPYLCMSHAPEPDLFIRTGGEQRISNFMLWQLAYTELYFTDVLWPAFSSRELDKAIASFRKRERRFGRTSEQLHGGESSAAPGGGLKEVGVDA